MTDETHQSAPTNRDQPERAEAADSGEVRVSTIVGDRLCIKCGFNLTGQPVMKEPRYELFIARCPECGCVASLQEYPVLGTWANRWAALAAALWLLLLLGGSFAFAGILTGVSFGSLAEGTRDFADWVGRRAAADETSGFGEQSHRFYTAAFIDIAWWEAQDRWALLRQAGGFRGVVLSEVVGPWLGILIGGFIFGVIAGVALLHARRWRLAFVLLLPIAIAAVFQISIYTSMRTDISLNATAQPSELVRLMLAPLILAGTNVWAYVGIVAGAWLGRPIARGLMRAFLPPRLRSSLSFLWLADGKTPPKP